MYIVVVRGALFDRDTQGHSRTSLSVPKCFVYHFIKDVLECLEFLAIFSRMSLSVLECLAHDFLRHVLEWL